MAYSLEGVAADGAASCMLYGVRPGDVETRLDALPAAQAAMARVQNFTGAVGTVVLLAGEQGLEAALLGLGDAPAVHGFGAAARALPAGSAWRIQPGAYDLSDAALGFLLGAYRFDRLKTKAPLGIATIAAEQVTQRVAILAEAICGARDLINTPANLLGPAELAAAARAVGERFAAKITSVTGAALTARYPAMGAVGAGSDRAAEAVLLEWHGSAARPDAPFFSLCGKGVCFDTGGYDLKPSAAMLRMKKDMGGAAIMLGVAHAVMALDLPVRLHLRLGCVENSISGHAMRPSDVLQTHAGLTVEVGNTDAEGRLVLCDMLAEAAKDSPDYLLDAATLTGAARVALGPDLPALFCTDDEFADTLLAAGRSAHDPLWRLPLAEGYDSWLDSSVADCNTVAAKPMAGAIIAALFLKRFVPKQIPWAHIDVYAWNDANRPGRPEGGEAQTLRAIVAMIEGCAAGSNRMRVSTG